MNSNRLLPPRRGASRSFLLSLGAATAALASAGNVRAQVTDPAVITPYGTACGVGVGATDTILGNGSHAVAIQVTVSPFAPALLALGLDALDVPIPGGACRLYTSPLDIWFAPSNGAGIATFPLNLPAATIGTVFVQGATLDAAMTIATSQGLELEFPGQSPTADPSTQTAYPCAFYQNYVWNYGGDGVGNVTGRVWWPSSTCQSVDGPPTGLPMVVFLHGNGMTYTDHDELLAHIARNGFVCISVSNGSHMTGSNEGRAREAISFLNGMYAFWGYADRLTTDVAFTGHSRGGEAAITAARLLAQNPGMGHVAYDVEAVISLAPTDGGGDNSDPKENLDGTMTRAFLALYGTHDPDVRGIRLEDGLAGPENTAFAIYDRAGDESSVEGVLTLADNLEKAMVLIEGATHRGFLDACNILAGGPIGCDAHGDAAKGYFNAFLRWKVNNQAAYAAYFDAGAVPTTLRVAEVDTFPQFGGHPRRVLDNFEQGGMATNTMGGSVSTSGNIVSAVENEAWQLDASSPHDTRGLRVRWNGVGQIGWSVPAAVLPLVGQQRDVGNYQHLSLRVAQDYLDAFNTAGVDQDFRIRLFTSNGWSSYVRVSDWARVPYPTYFFTHPFPYPAGDFTKTALTTVRIPLSAFGGANLASVQNVWLYFGQAGTPTSGSVMLDSLEFVN
jgi:hypothetical protein